MPGATLSEALDNLYTTTWQNMKAELVDQIFDATPFWFLLKDKGGMESVSGGRFLTEPLQYAKSDRVSFIGKGGTVELAENEFLTEAVDDWKFLTDSIVRFGVDEMKNRGKNQIINLMNAKLTNSRMSLEDKLEDVLLDKTSMTAAQQTLAFNDLDDIIAESAGTVHGINSSNDTWWDNKRNNMTGVSFAVNGTNRMRTMLNDVSQNKKNDRPQLILTDQTSYEYYEETVEEQKRIVNQKLGDASFENVQYKGIPMVWSPQTIAGSMYFINFNFLKFKFDPQMNFDMTAWKDIPDQVNDKAAQIMLAGNLMTSRRRTQGVIYNIDTV